jgi:hypothetical protein
MKLFYEFGGSSMNSNGGQRAAAVAAGLLYAVPAFAVFGGKELAYKRPVI